MNVYECNGENIFMKWKMKFSIPRDDSRGGMENLISFTEWKYFYHCTNENIHYLFYVTPKYKIISKFFKSKIS